MELSPRLYNWLVRPSWFMDLFINNKLENEFDFNNKKILDFGCGIGSSSSIFDPDNYLGVDCDSRRIHYARNIHSKHNFDVLDGYSIPVPENSFDYILVISVLHHIVEDHIIWRQFDNRQWRLSRNAK